MTVEELIAVLQRMPAHATVVIGDSITPYVLQDVTTERRYHTGAFNVRRCAGSGCVQCRLGERVVDEVVLL